jgi:hypothetical protein
VLRARGDLCRDPDLLELFLQGLAGALDELLAVAAPLVHHRLDLGVLARVERLKRKVLELPLDRVDTEPMCERRVHLEGLARLLELLLPAEILDRPHVVQPVGKLDEDDAPVLRHRDDHLAVVLGLCMLAALELDPRQLGDAFDEPADLIAEFRAHLVDRRARVLDHVVDERGRKRLVVGAELPEDARDAERVQDEVLPAPTLLPLVSPRAVRERPLEEIPVGLRVVGGDLAHERLEELAMLLWGACRDRCRHTPIVALGPALPL